MNSPLFSVATPTRNALHCLRRCVGSVRGQTDVTVEHLIQDAQSSDGTVPWLQAQGLGAVSEADAGMYDAIHRAWARSKGAYLSWLNSDEQYLPSTLGYVHRFFEANPQVDVLFGNYIVVDPEGNPVAFRREVPFRHHYVRNGFLYAQSCTIFFRRALFDRGLLQFDTSLRYAADHDLMLRLHDAKARIQHVDRYLGLFGIDGNNLSGHARMQTETQEVQHRHGACRSALLRQLVFSGRRLERAWRGAYRAQSMSFDFATDERPNYITVSAKQVGARYALADQTAE